MTKWKRGKAVSPEVALSLICHLHVQQRALLAWLPPGISSFLSFTISWFSVLSTISFFGLPARQLLCRDVCLCHSISLDANLNQKYQILNISLLTMDPNKFPWTNRDWKRKRQNKGKWKNNRSGTVWCSVPTIGSVKATRAEPSWLMRIWKGRQL